MINAKILKFHNAIWTQVGSGKFCPRCELDKVKVELKLLPNKLLTCGNCQAAYRLIGNQMFQVLL
ncbi:MAG: hypothetical protein NPMRIOTA_100033 [Nitrosopumilales archaeon]|nr:MAG: hypothetical protein NPMRIOTA_100033 [Nitrosopumilales archaeon]